MNSGDNFSGNDGAVLRARGLDAPTERQIHTEVRDDLLAQPVRPVLCGGDRLQVQGLRLQEQIDRDDRNAPSFFYAHSGLGSILDTVAKDTEDTGGLTILALS